MATLTVDNIGPIKHAELEIKKHTVLIGPQGSGKSTLAKLVAIAAGRGIWSETSVLFNDYNSPNALKYFGIDDFFSHDSTFIFGDKYYEVEYKDKDISIFFNQEGINKYKSLIALSNRTYDESYNTRLERSINNSDGRIKATSHNYIRGTEAYTQLVAQTIKYDTVYISSERTLLSLLSSSIWSLVNNNINLPKSITSTGSYMERAINDLLEIDIPYLEIKFYKRDGKAIVHGNTNLTDLEKSASGYQALIPLQLIVEHQRRQDSWMSMYRFFIVEEPELNIYPNTQKELIYNLLSGLSHTENYADAKWLFTTHSPYVLSSLNTLLLAYKVAQQNAESREVVKQVIPERSWINPDEFSAYYVADGTAVSIIDPDTGLINDNKLDEASEFLADELSALFDLYRPTARA